MQDPTIVDFERILLNLHTHRVGYRQGRPQRIRYLRISVGSVCSDSKIELFLSFQGVFEF